MKPDHLLFLMILSIITIGIIAQHKTRKINFDENKKVAKNGGRDREGKSMIWTKLYYFISIYKKMIGYSFHFSILHFYYSQFQKQCLSKSKFERVGGCYLG